MITFFISIITLSLPIFLITGPAIPNLIIILMSLYSMNKFYKDIELINNFKIIFSFFLFFIIYIIFVSLISDNIFFSLEASLFYLRYILFSLTIYFLLNKNTKLITYFLYILTFCISFVSIDAIFQYIYGINLFGLKIYADDGRISGIFHDELILGSYIVKLLPLLISLFFLYIDKIKKIYFLYIFIFLLIVFFTVTISGERVSLLYCCFILVNLFIVLPFKKLSFLILSFTFIMIGLIIYNNPSTKNRLIDRTKADLGILSTGYDLKFFSDTHEQHIKTSIEIFKENTIFGSGPKMFRVKCKDYKNKYYHGCSTHPHNTYFQLLSETGIIGTLTIIAIFFIILYQYLKIFFTIILQKNNNKIVFSKFFLIISFLITLMPIIPSGNFFGSYINIFFYFPLGFYLYVHMKYKEKN